MENSLFVLLGFAEAAEKYMAENSGKTLEGLSNIDLPNLKKSITDSIGSFDVSKDSNSEKIGELVFKQFLKEKENPKKEVILSITGGMLFNVIAEPIFSYIYYSLILGNADKAASYITLTKWVTTSTNALLTIIIASLLYFPLRKHININ